MRGVLKIALATAAIGLGTVATPASAGLVAGDPCHDGYVQIGGQSSIACVGFYSSNLLQGNAGQATPADVQGFLATLLTNTPNPPGVQDSEPGYSPPYNLDVDTILDTKEGLGGANTFTFSGGTVMSGLTVVGLHFGNTPDADENNVTAFYLFNLLNPSNTVTLVFNGQLNGQGSSNAQLYTTGGGPVPEPATWAMMLVGFGGIGMAMRRSRKANGKLLQLA